MGIGGNGRLDFTEIRNVLANVERLLSSHDGELVRPSERSLAPLQRASQRTASLTHDLRLAQDFLQLACAELSAVYWTSQGDVDLRRPRSDTRTIKLPTGDTNRRVGTAPGPATVSPIRSGQRATSH